MSDAEHDALVRILRDGCSHALYGNCDIRRCYAATDESRRELVRPLVFAGCTEKRAADAIESLTRERDEARRISAEYIARTDPLLDKLDAAIRERDQARAELAKLKEDWPATVSEFVGTITKLTEQRDGARAMFETLCEVYASAMGIDVTDLRAKCVSPLAPLSAMDKDGKVDRAMSPFMVTEVAELVDALDAANERCRLLHDMIRLVMSIPDLTDEQLEQLKENCRIAQTMLGRDG